MGREKRNRCPGAGQRAKPATRGRLFPLWERKGKALVFPPNKRTDAISLPTPRRGTKTAPLQRRNADGRPARGISAIIDLAGGHRVAWLWLRQVNPVLGGRKPIDLLKQEQVDEVVDVAQAYFNPQ